jgi:hypothetical protein
MAIIRPVAQVGTLSGPSGFRPNSIVFVLSKVLKHVNGRNLLMDCQSGFRRRHSTATALVRVTKDLRKAKADEKVTVHVL